VRGGFGRCGGCEGAVLSSVQVKIAVVGAEVVNSNEWAPRRRRQGWLSHVITSLHILEES
jgi:hypothetical protein